MQIKLTVNIKKSGIKNKLFNNTTDLIDYIMSTCRTINWVKFEDLTLITKENALKDPKYLEYLKEYEKYTMSNQDTEDTEDTLYLIDDKSKLALCKYSVDTIPYIKSDLIAIIGEVE